MTQCCATCKFWERDSARNDIQLGGLFSRCRRFPKILSYPDDEQIQEQWERFDWPWMIDHDWCGEWKPYLEVCA